MKGNVSRNSAFVQKQIIETRFGCIIGTTVQDMISVHRRRNLTVEFSDLEERQLELGESGSK